MRQLTRLFVGLLVAASVVAAATAQATTRQSLNGTVKLAELSHTGTPPINGTAVEAGTYKGKAGNGAITGTTSYAAPKFTAKLRTYNLKGTIVTTSTGAGQLNPDGSVSFSGTGKVVGGTGRYRGATGSFTFSGSQPKDSSVATFTIKGSYKY